MPDPLDYERQRESVPLANMTNGTPSLDYASPGERQRKARSTSLLVLLLVTAVVLTVPSIWAGMPGSDYYMPVRKADAAVRIGLASAMLALWVVWSFAVVYLVLRRMVDPALLLALLWALTVIYFLYFAASDYLDDVITHQGWTANATNRP